MSEIKTPHKSKNPKKNGRPELGEEKKTERMNVMGTKEDRRTIETKAHSQNVSVSSFLLDLGLSKKIIPPPPAVNLKTLVGINRIGRNLNVLIVLLKKDRRFNLTAIEITVNELLVKIAEVGEVLIGKSFYDEAKTMENETDSSGLYSNQKTDAQMPETECLIM